MTTENGAITPRAAAVLQAAATIYASYGFAAQVEQNQKVAVEDAEALLQLIEKQEDEDDE